MYPEPVEIIPRLYLGNVESSSPYWRRKFNISAVVRLSNGPAISPEDTDIFRISIEDSPLENISQHFFDVIRFIDEARYMHRNVLVHCMAGMSRSATIVIAYIAYHFQWPIDKAYEFVRRKAPWIEPNVGFIQQLLDSEHRLTRYRGRGR